MVNGHSYTISLQNGQSVTFAYDELSLVSRAIKVNQVGYLPGVNKYGYIGAYLQDLGPMSIPDNTTFSVIDAASGQAVLTGPVTLRAANPQFNPAIAVSVSGENIYEMDFSSLNTPGNYFLSVEGVEYGIKIWTASLTAEGGVAGFVMTNSHPALNDPNYPYAYSLRTRWCSLLYAAACAQFAQLVKPFNADKAAQYQAYAIQAYTFGNDPTKSLGTITVPAKTNRGTGTDYSFTFTESDAFNKPFLIGAKIRLFLLTQDQSYLTGLQQLLTDVQTAFSYNGASIKLMPTQWPFVPADCGLWLYSGLMQPEMASALPASVITTWKNFFISLGDTYAKMNATEFYRRSRTASQATQMAWGADCMTNHAKVLAFAHYLTKDPKYKQAALLNIDYMLGGNATGTSWTTGIGYVYPIPIHHAVSTNDGIVDPVPGIAIYGPNEGNLNSPTDNSSPNFNTLWIPKDPSGNIIQMMKPALYNANNQVVLPRLRNWQPHPMIAVPMNEFTIWETMSGAAFAYGYLLNEGWTAPDWLLKRQPRDPRVLFGQWYVP